MTLTEELTLAVKDAREQEVKVQVLHDARIQTHREMREAAGRHEFQVEACRVAEDTLGALRHRVESLVRRQAFELEKSCK